MNHLNSCYDKKKVQNQMNLHIELSLNIIIMFTNGKKQINENDVAS